MTNQPLVSHSASYYLWRVFSLPSINTLLVFIPVASILNRYIEYINQRFSSSSTTRWQFKSIFHVIAFGNSWPCIAFVVLLILLKVIKLLRDRQQAFKIFERGNIPCVRNKNVMSGNLFEVIVPFKNVEVIEDYHCKLGKTYGMFYGPDPWVFTTDLDLLRRVFEKETDRNELRLPFITEFNLSIGHVQGNHWRQTRRIIGPAFSHKNMKTDNIANDIEISIEKLMNCLGEHPIERNKQSPHSPQNGLKHNGASSSTVTGSLNTGDTAIGSSANKGDARIIELGMNFKKFTVEVIFKVAYGMDDGVVNWTAGESDRLIEIIHEASQYIRGPIVWTSIMFEETQRLLGFLSFLSPISKYINYIHSVLDENLEKRRREVRKRLQSNNNNNNNNNQTTPSSEQQQKSPSLQDNSPARRMIDTIMESCSNNKMSDIELRANLFFIFVAGFETTANTLTVLFWYLARNQRVQEKLRESLSSEGGEQSEYLEWCIQETLRLYPAVPSGIGRKLSEDLEHEGMQFKRGTAIMSSIYSIHHSEEYWGENVEEFYPERFAAPLKHPLQYFAFGHGPRYCLGQHLASLELRMVIPRIILKYKIETCSRTPQKLDAVSPNLVHWIIHGRVDVRFVELSSL